VDSGGLRKRAQDAIAGYVGDTNRVHGSIEVACRILDDLEKRSPKRRT
jgi:hypothetical protein